MLLYSLIVLLFYYCNTLINSFFSTETILKTPACENLPSSFFLIFAKLVKLNVCYYR